MALLHHCFGGGRGVIVPFYSVQDCSFLLMNCWDRDDFGETPRQWRRQVCSAIFNCWSSVLSCAYCVYNFIQSGIYRKHCWKASFAQFRTSYFSGMCFTVWRAGLLTVNRRIPILIDQSKYFTKTLRTKRKLLGQMIVPRICLKWNLSLPWSTQLSNFFCYLNFTDSWNILYFFLRWVHPNPERNFQDSRPQDRNNNKTL